MPRRRTLEQMDKDAHALDLWLSGKSHRQISADMGWRSSAAAHGAVQRALRDRQRDKFEQVDHFTAAVERIQAALRRCQEIIDTDHYLAAPGGKIATMWHPGQDGQDGREVPVLDDGPKQRAITEMRHLNDQLILLMDLKPASKQRIQVVTEDVVDAEIRKLADEIARAQGAKKVPAE